MAARVNHVEKSSGPPWFEEVAADRGVVWSWTSGHDGAFLQPEIIGGGAAMFDYDNDGWLDLYMVQAGSIMKPEQNPSNVLYRNREGGRFEEVAGAAGADDRGYGMGVACGDIHNDGFIDLYVANLGPNVLYSNVRGERFENITDRAGVGHPGWSSSAAFLDFNRDGYLDLYVCNYINWTISSEQECHSNSGAIDYCSPATYNAPSVDALYLNTGDGTFIDATSGAGLDSSYGTGLGVVCADFNRDGWIDIFVANDGMRNQLWVNQSGQTCRDMAMFLGCAVDEEGKAKAGMGVDFADLDDDGDFDVIVCNLRRESDTLYLNEGSYFTDITAKARLRAPTRPFTGFGIGLIDFDNDGVHDLYQAHGLVGADGTEFLRSDPYIQPNLLFRGHSDLTFEEVHPRGGTSPVLEHTSRGVAFGDIDNDGGVDALVVNRDAPAYLLRNVVSNRGHWIALRVLEHNRDAYGARVALRLGERTITRTVRAAYSFMASNDPRVHIGLGEVNRVESVFVQWPDGTIETFGPFEADRIVEVVRGKGARAR